MTCHGQIYCSKFGGQQSSTEINKKQGENLLVCVYKRDFSVFANAQSDAVTSAQQIHQLLPAY